MSASGREDADERPGPLTAWCIALSPPRFFVAGSLVLITILVYVPVLHCGFIWDDDGYILNNETLRSTAGLGQIWFDFGATQDYYPLSFTTFWCEYQLWGLDPRGYHLDNVILHALNALIVYWLLVRLRVPGAAFAALIFAVHPVHVESVAWITERKNVLSGLFYFLSIAAFMRAAGLDQDTPEPRLRLPFYFLSLGLFLLALLSKTVTVTLPLILPVLIWWKTGRLRARDLGCVLPYFLVAFPIFLLGGMGDANFGGAGVGVLSHTAEIARLDAAGGGGRWDLTLVQRSLLVGRVMWFYAVKLLVPVNLSFVYPHWTIDPTAWWQYAIALSAAAVPITCWLFRQRLGRGPLAAVLFYGLTLAPASGLFNFYFQRFSFVADHLQYLASLGIIVLVVTLAARLVAYLPTRLTCAALLGAAVIAFTLAVLTINQQSCYQNPTTLWISTLEKNPASLLARVNLSVILRTQGQNKLALQVLEDGVPYCAQPHELSGLHTEIGEFHALTGNRQAALDHFKRALEVDEQCVRARLLLAALRARQGDRQGALEHYRKLLEFLPPESEEGRYVQEVIRFLEHSDLPLAPSSARGP